MMDKMVHADSADCTSPLFINVVREDELWVDFDV